MRTKGIEMMRSLGAATLGTSLLGSGRTHPRIASPLFDLALSCTFPRGEIGNFPGQALISTAYMRNNRQRAATKNKQTEEKFPMEYLIG